ncbi:hypothetical protein V1502_10770 [Bacillus sp. SCS-153A]|uniref:hypothetical protein n=1 Tax=Rossellomorea sedimentorum TaxID=3115294 RepID=UPI003905C78A
MNDRLRKVEVTVKKVEETVNRIEVSQTEDVVRLLKITQKKTDSETDYINSRLTQMDKRIYQLEKRIES